MKKLSTPGRTMPNTTVSAAALTILSDFTWSSMRMVIILLFMMLCCVYSSSSGL